MQIYLKNMKVVNKIYENIYFKTKTENCEIKSSGNEVKNNIYIYIYENAVNKNYLKEYFVDENL